MIDIETVPDVPTLVKEAKWLEGKTLAEVQVAIKSSDAESRVTTKGRVGHLIEKGFFGIDKNSIGRPDIDRLGVEVKTCPLKYNKARTRLSVKEPLSLNIINYRDEAECEDITDSALYRKNRKILFVVYVHDKKKDRSEYLIRHVFLWEMDDDVLDELRPDYKKILSRILKGEAHMIHQPEHCYLTLCPKHSGKYKDPNCTKSKTTQPFSSIKPEVRAFRLKNKYMNLVISRYLGEELGKGGWPV